MTVCMEFDPVTEYNEAGITAYVDTLRYYSVAVKGPSSNRVLVLRKRSLHTNPEETVSAVKLDNGPIQLRIRSSPSNFHFEVAKHSAAEKTEWVEIGSGSAKDMSEVGFTGRVK